jgi:glucose-6-phosphate 1-dehydrogenase
MDNEQKDKLQKAIDLISITLYEIHSYSDKAKVVYLSVASNYCQEIADQIHDKIQAKEKERINGE